MFDDFLYKNKWLISAILLVIIIGGISLIWQDQVKRTKKIQESQQITELQAQNEMLRAQLSQEAAKSVAGTSVEQNQNNTDKVDINTATVEELDTLPNIGPARAADIIAYREENGSFKTIEEIKNIKGIGDKSFEELKDLITAGE